VNWPSTAGTHVHVAEKRIYITEVTEKSEEHQLRFVGFLNKSDDQCFNTEISVTSFDLGALTFNVTTKNTGAFISTVSSNCHLNFVKFFINVLDIKMSMTIRGK